MKIKNWFGCIGLAILTLMWSVITPVRADVPVVCAVLFYSPTCPHCHKVITEDLMPLLERYGDQLRIVGVDTSSQGGQVLFLSAIEHFNIPPERQAVPMLIIDDNILLGSLEIPEKFPGLVDAYLAQGGVDLPEIPGLAEALAAAQAQTTSTPEPTSTPVPAQSTPAISEAIAGETLVPEPTPTALQSGLIMTDDSPASLRDKLAHDPAGNALAILVLIGMLVSVGTAPALFLSMTNEMKQVAPPLAIPILCLVGFGIAAYLTYVEVTQVTAVCGPVGDCNTVQQSEHAHLFGVLPIGVLGLAGYLAILLDWSGSRFGSGQVANLASLALLGMTLFGTLFSIYLTFLEPFVIGATCAWCLSSAVIMTILMWLSITPGKLALTNLRYGETNTYTKSRIRRSIQSK
jgi:uncharacterized membrane protein